MRTLVVGLGVLVACAAPALREAAALDTRHPHFDDRGTLVWTTDSRAALGAARGRGCGVLVVSGAPDDAATRELVTRVIPDASVAARLKAMCLGLALDSRRAEPQIDPLFREALGVSSATPGVAFLGPDGRWITGFRGAAALPRFLQHLLLAERALAAPAIGAASPASPGTGATAARGDDTHLPAPVQRPVTRTAVPSAARPALGAHDTNPRTSSLIVREPSAPATETSVPRLTRVATQPAPIAVAPPPAPAPPDGDSARSRTARAALDRALALVLAGDRDGAVSALRAVRIQAAGLPEALEAERGIDAILTAADLERLSDPSSVLAETLRRTKRDELRGTRWARLFAS